MVKKARDPPTPDEIGRLKAKLERCRNPALTDDRILVFVGELLIHFISSNRNPHVKFYQL